MKWLFISINALTNQAENTSKDQPSQKGCKACYIKFTSMEIWSRQAQVNKAAHRLANKATLFLDSPSIKFKDVSDCIANIAKA